MASSLLSATTVPIGPLHKNYTWLLKKFVTGFEQVADKSETTTQHYTAASQTAL